MSVCLFVYLFVCLFVCLYVCLSVFLSIFLSVCLFVYLSVCLCLSLCLYVCLSLCLFLCVCLSVCLFISLCLSADYTLESYVCSSSCEGIDTIDTTSSVAQEAAREGGKYQILQGRECSVVMVVISLSQLLCYAVGVFLHVLADTLGSVGVMISSFLIDRFGIVGLMLYCLALL